MDDLIRRMNTAKSKLNTIKLEIENDLIRRCDAIKVSPAESIFEIRSLPSVDAAPVRNGKWKSQAVSTLLNRKGEVISFYVKHYCSECGLESHFYYGLTKYCPNCGAKLDGDEHAID